MTDWNEISISLTETLSLTSPPLGLSMVDAATAAASGVAAFDAPMQDPTADGRSGRVPASCVFWMEAEHATFSTEPQDHGNCSVGSWVHGFSSLDEIAKADDVGALFASGWVTADDVGQIAVMDDRPAGIVYGPLGDSGLEPDVVVMRLEPEQMMVLGDAVPGLTLSAKPQCQIIPTAFAGGAAASMGCALSRERTGMPSSQLTFAVAAARLPEIAERLSSVVSANSKVRSFAGTDLSRF